MKKLIFLLIIILSCFSVCAFDDMTGYEWANEAVFDLVQKGVINGVGENVFAPQDNVTYEQLAKMVVTAFNLNDESGTLPDNINPERWSADYIKKANNLFTESFEPTALVPRFEVASVITKAAFMSSDIMPDKSRLSGFTDVDAQSSIIMQEWIAEAKYNGIVNGYEDGTFRPYENVTRAETAVMLQRALNLDDKGDNEMAEIRKVSIDMENGGKMVVELYPQYAPKTVENFIKLTESGFYDGLIFHRVISGFMIQGGDPEGTGMGGSKEKIIGEFSSNGFSGNTLRHTRGVISMARSSSPNSASSQFFIMHKDSPHLDGQYAAFGKVVEGIEVVDEIAATDTDMNDRPITPVTIKKIQIIE